jgi:YD repeat-containing protein
MTGFTLEPTDRQAALRDRLLPALGRRLGLAGLHEHLDRVGSAVDVAGTDTAFTWDDADQRDAGWMPQGISTSADARRDEGAHTVLVSWYAKGPTGRDSNSRITVVDRSDPAVPRYAHVHLIEPARRWWRLGVHERRVPVHAGGIAWWGTTVLVASTRGGLRVFDLDDIVRTSDGRLVLPQSGAHQAKTAGSPRPLRWSFISLDRSDPDRPWLIAGEYSREGTGTRIARFTLDPGTGRPAGRRCVAAEVIEANIPSMQGATRVDGVYQVSASRGSRRPGNLYTGGRHGFTRHAEALPIGPEDLSYEATADRLWTVTEYPGSRVVAAVPRPRHPHTTAGPP